MYQSQPTAVGGATEYKSPYGAQAGYWAQAAIWAAVPVALCAIPAACQLLLSMMRPSIRHAVVMAAARDAAFALGLLLYTPICLNLSRAFGRLRGNAAPAAPSTAVFSDLPDGRCFTGLAGARSPAVSRAGVIFAFFLSFCVTAGFGVHSVTGASLLPPLISQHVKRGRTAPSALPSTRRGSASAPAT